MPTFGRSFCHHRQTRTILYVEGCELFAEHPRHVDGLLFVASERLQCLWTDCSPSTLLLTLHCLSVCTQCCSWNVK